MRILHLLPHFDPLDATSENFYSTTVLSHENLLFRLVVLFVDTRILPRTDLVRSGDTTDCSAILQSEHRWRTTERISESHFSI